MCYTNIWAEMLNNRAKKGAQAVLDDLCIERGSTIADIGSGGGYFVFQFEQRTGSDGIVFAVDTNQKLLAFIEKEKKKKHFSNVKTINGKADGCPLPEKSCDLIFMRNVFHHIENPIAYFSSLKESVKTGGRIAIIEWDDLANGFSGRAGHATPKERILKTMQEAGFIRTQTHSYLAGQSFQVFKIGMDHCPVK